MNLVVGQSHQHRWVPIPGLSKFPQRLCRCGAVRAPGGFKSGRGSVTLSPGSGLESVIDIDQQAAPAAPGAGITRLFMDSADGGLKARRGVGAAEQILPASAPGGVGSAIVDELRGYGLTQSIVATMNMTQLSESALIQLGTLGAITFTQTEEDVLMQVGDNTGGAVTTVGFRYNLPFAANRVFIALGYEHNSSAANEFNITLQRTADGHLAQFDHVQVSPNYRYLKDVGGGAVLIQNWGAPPAENARGLMMIFWARGKFAYAWDGNQEADSRRRFLRDALVRNSDTGPANPIDRIDIDFIKGELNTGVRNVRVHGPLIIAIGP